MDTSNALAVHDGGYKLTVKHGLYSRLANEGVGHELKALTVQFVTQGLAFWHGGTHRLGAFLELTTDTARFDRVLMSIPSEPFNTDNCDVAAKAAKALK